ncbi:MAG TPA: DUF4136 domain-containing protein [Longimicrobiales bacterium]|nr:DUF4136 domain-containing protein [Longimicrobiales bacterium]
MRWNGWRNRTRRSARGARGVAGSVLVALVAALAGCAHRAATNVAYNPSVDFSRYRTYSWREGTPPPAKLTDIQIMAGVEKQLAERGLRRVDHDGDLTVTYHMSTEKSLDITTYDYVTGPYWSTYWYPGGTQTVVKEVKQGTLVVDLIDRRRNELVWRGIGTDRLPNNPASVARRVDDVTEKMFDKFPPRAPG